MPFQPPGRSPDTRPRVPAARRHEPATGRVLGHGVALEPDDLDALEGALAPLETVGVGARLSDRSATQPFALVDGWIALARTAVGDKRQILALFLPGDVVGLDTATAPLRHGEIVALTAARIRRLSAHGRALIAGRPRLVQALAAHNLQHQARLQDQVFRIGVLPAFERVAHLLGELHGRLSLAAADGRCLVPVRQEILAQTLGISLVHVNRTLQALSAQKLAWLDRGRLIVPDETVLAAVWSGSDGRPPPAAHSAASPRAI